jgi:hypothetical protein
LAGTGQTQGVSNVLDGVVALVRAELRAAVAEAISNTVSEPEDTSHLTARELAERIMGVRVSGFLDHSDRLRA